MSSQCVWNADNPTAPDWQCYLNRYADLRAAFGDTNVVSAENHYNSWGAGEGRDSSCA